MIFIFQSFPVRSDSSREGCETDRFLLGRYKQLYFSFWLSIVREKYILISSFLWFFNSTLWGYGKLSFFSGFYCSDKRISWKRGALNSLNKSLKQKLWIWVAVKAFRDGLCLDYGKERNEKILQFINSSRIKKRKRVNNNRLQWIFWRLKT